MTFTPQQRAYLAHWLTLAGNAESSLTKTIASAKVDMNPHQVEAALFALASPLSSGVMLADEVGLGKTIEAALVLAQKWAERKRRLLLIVPATLRKQWSMELESKFSLPSRILERANFNAAVKNGALNPFEVEQAFGAAGVVICSYEFAANKYAEVAAIAWDFVVLDEAHKLRNIYKKSGAKTATKINEALQNRAKALLSATPLQNNLQELYGLVSIIDPHFFGSLEAFRARYGRMPVEDSELFLLRHRLRKICFRTLRREVQQEGGLNFTQRYSLTEDFTPSAAEQALYQRVSEYLQDNDILALKPNARHLVTLVIRKILASSSRAIAGTLSHLLARLEGKLGLQESMQDDDLDTVDQWLTNISTQLIEPPVLLNTRLVEVPNKQGEMRPLMYVQVIKSLFVHRSSNGYFHRVGSSKRAMSPDWLARLFQQRSMTRLLRFDEQLVPRTGLDNIDPTLQARFVRGDLPTQMQLKKLYLLGTDEEQQARLTVSGVLLLTARPADFLSAAYMQCVAYQGTERNAEYQLDAQDCDGALDQQIQCALAFVKRNMRVEAVKRPGRIDIPQYDLSAVYEAIVNAVAHRDYAIYGARIRLHLFHDRLELISPGGLPNTLTLDSMDANSISRNETLVNLLSRYYPADPISKRQHIIERRGEGVPLILRASEHLSSCRPRYELQDNSALKLTIYAASRKQNGVFEVWNEDINDAN